MECSICKKDLIPEKDKVLQLREGYITSGEYQDFTPRGSTVYFHPDCFGKEDTKAPKGVTFQTGWEDGGLASVEKLICSCGTNLLEGYTDRTVTEDTVMECPNCGKKFQFIWEGMTIQEVK